MMIGFGGGGISALGRDARLAGRGDAFRFDVLAVFALADVALDVALGGGEGRFVTAGGAVTAKPFATDRSGAVATGTGTGAAGGGAGDVAACCAVGAAGAGAATRRAAAAVAVSFTPPISPSMNGFAMHS